MIRLFKKWFNTEPIAEKFSSLKDFGRENLRKGIYLFFDTETNGLARDINIPYTSLNNWPRITQLAWQLYDSDKKLLSEGNHLIKPDGWIIPEEVFFIENKMSTKRCESEGLPLTEVLELFFGDYLNANFLIAHNLKFDINVLRAELLRYRLEIPKEINKICTMIEARSHSKALGIPSNKFPSLNELHNKLFGVDYEDSHDALSDTRACADCFFKLQRIIVGSLKK